MVFFPRAVGKELAKLDDIAIVTGGFCGVGETVSHTFFDETQDNTKSRVWHILPERDSQVTQLFVLFFISFK